MKSKNIYKKGRQFYMNEKNISITLDVDTFENVKTYAVATGVSIEVFIEAIVCDFFRFQQAEMEEVYFNDDGTAWLMPTDSF